MKQRLKNLRPLFVEEGPGFIVMASDSQGREYTLLDGAGGYRIMSFVKADMVIDQIKAAGYMVNPDHWAVRSPYGTSAWLLDGEEDRQIEDERYGYC